jgi:methionine--tRNA ligase
MPPPEEKSPESKTSSNRRYITTPIYYVNDKPHIGHIYTTTVCDVYARFMRFSGHDVFFLTGTDEHGLKVEKSAQARGVSPQALADENAAEFQRVLSTFGLTNNDFIRTTQPHHERQVQTFVKQLLESGAVYLGQFEGWYDEGQEEYYTETKAKDLNYTSPISKKPLTRAHEKNYYFRLSAYQKQLEGHFAKNPGFVRPEGRRNEVLGRLREGLQDVPISRTNFSWGIPLPPPAEPGHVVYVWVDALLNYITALGLGDSPATSKLYVERSKYWPATYHVVGKEILWFHAVIWPAMLMALDLDLPQCVYAHSFWISEGQKMSKSLGNFIDLAAIQRYLGTYGLDAWRYYLATQGPLGAADADFAAAHFHKVYSDDLANTVGNSASRITTMIGKYFDSAVPPEKPDTIPAANRIDWRQITAAMVEQSTRAMESLDLTASLATSLQVIRRVDGFINTTEPFKVAKDPARKDELGTILYQCLETLRIASLLLWPALPGKMEELWKAMGISIDPKSGKLADLAKWGGLKPGTKVQKVALFPRVEAAPAAEPALSPA